MDTSNPERDAIHDAIAANSSHVQETADGQAILTGWIVVSERMDPDGGRYLAHCRAAQTSRWTARGMIHDVLFANDWDDS